jgi:hypothetical protein
MPTTKADILFAGVFGFFINEISEDWSHEDRPFGNSRSSKEELKTQCLFCQRPAFPAPDKSVLWASGRSK